MQVLEEEVEEVEEEEEQEACGWVCELEELAVEEHDGDWRTSMTELLAEQEMEVEAVKKGAEHLSSVEEAEHSPSECSPPSRQPPLLHVCQ